MAKPKRSRINARTGGRRIWQQYHGLDQICKRMGVGSRRLKRLREHLEPALAFPMYRVAGQWWTSDYLIFEWEKRLTLGRRARKVIAKIEQYATGQEMSVLPSTQEFIAGIEAARGVQASR